MENVYPGGVMPNERYVPVGGFLGYVSLLPCIGDIKG